MKEQKIYRPRPVSGFPEWLPEEKMVEQQWMDKIRAVFESYGFAPVETPSAEEIDVLLAKGGDTDKEIYTLTRLQAEEGDEHDARLALHFDLTVPFARYAAMRFNDLTFPFKRYQIQRVWRGERPQKGRFREFYQCDIDVVNIDALPLHFDAEMPAIMFEAYQQLDIPPVEIRLSNRKILIGYLKGLGISDEVMLETTRTLDRLHKIGADAVVKMLYAECDLDTATAQKALALAEIRTTDASFAEQVRALGIEHDLLDEGLEELVFVMDNLKHLPEGAVVVDLSIVRGLDYYTGTILEVYFVDDPGFGAVGSGGRYDDLAGSYINKNLPGIGVSIGLTRLFSKMLDEGKLDTWRKCPTDILVVLPDEDRRAVAADAANRLRKRGFRVELFPSASKLKRQLGYAEKKNIPFVWFPPFKDGKAHEVKDMTSGEQKHSDPDIWEFPE